MIKLNSINTNNFGTKHSFYHPNMRNVGSSFKSHTTIRRPTVHLKAPFPQQDHRDSISSSQNGFEDLEKEMQLHQQLLDE